MTRSHPRPDLSEFAGANHISVVFSKSLGDSSVKPRLKSTDLNLRSKGAKSLPKCTFTQS